MRWYLLKTWVGKEKELVNEITRTVPSFLYNECFVIYQERIWRKQQRSVVHVEPLFPGCVFLTCEEQGFLIKRFEQIPAIANLLACKNLTILPMMKEDGEFLKKISGEDHMVKLSYVLKNEQGQVCRISEPLGICREQIEKYQFKKRYAMIRHRLWGEDQAIVLGIMLKEDAERKLLYENTEISVEMSGIALH
ncbi:MAG: hypothetical protein HFG54_15425 [Lachnospiraceae bacterium]|jgi:transcription antitermination factor NusG|nr:hypothetical protein [Lachnospiraceae bacterium]